MRLVDAIGRVAADRAVDAAGRSPMTFGSARACGASLTSVPAHQGPQEFAAYFESSLRAHTPTSPVPPSGFALRGLTTRALLVLLGTAAILGDLK